MVMGQGNAAHRKTVGWAAPRCYLNYVPFSVCSRTFSAIWGGMGSCRA